VSAGSAPGDDSARRLGVSRQRSLLALSTPAHARVAALVPSVVAVLVPSLAGTDARAAVNGRHVLFGFSAAKQLIA
jgi:hypothetical protein